LVPLPPSKSVVGCRWVYKIKINFDGSIERSKLGWLQKDTLNSMVWIILGTFTPIAKITTIRTLIIVASVRQWYISQFDVKNAFLNGDLQEEIYMAPPPSVSHDSGYVCKLKKALYGLKQTPRAWFEKFYVVISSLGFVSGSHDSVLFIKSTDACRIILFLYIDDMIITGDDIDGISVLKTELVKQFEMKDLGSLRYFLGIEVRSLLT